MSLNCLSQFRGQVQFSDDRRSARKNSSNIEEKPVLRIGVHSAVKFISGWTIGYGRVGKQSAVVLILFLGSVGLPASSQTQPPASPQAPVRLFIEAREKG